MFRSLNNLVIFIPLALIALVIFTAPVIALDQIGAPALLTCLGGVLFDVALLVWFSCRAG